MLVTNFKCNREQNCLLHFFMTFNADNRIHRKRVIEL